MKIPNKVICYILNGKITSQVNFTLRDNKPIPWNSMQLVTLKHFQHICYKWTLFLSQFSNERWQVLCHSQNLQSKGGRETHWYSFKWNCSIALMVFAALQVCLLIMLQQQILCFQVIFMGQKSITDSRQKKISQEFKVLLHINPVCFLAYGTYQLDNRI